ncbi:ricin-type beta-trefoil lectin domain protein [Kitasatospora sp. NBC_00240]|uniref:ricin-type beta-trefoil lectin domain protein n=1 Tax=Kitasatospora sp. NBC_00240 TaxID=2903567 RepID=UPI00225356B7|nr:ricin-type beta-trefoil lectin domain protein [Kitasatospora sp. NBC_00240]MCX5208436.1 ricin-type beta-trefoil lectin domain protein [Kitasatospora sp. NBC_00240]
MGAVLAVLTAMIGVCVPTIAHAATLTSITIDGTKPGLTFDGIGAASGGGGNSRLLIDYPEPQRSQLLDYLFKPGYGASLQSLKIEIGGDTNSTDGAEASIEHTKGAVDCNQGYEWWVAEQAKARNPGIKLYGLAWGAPGWIGGGNFWSQDMIDYLMSWFGCAAQHDLSIDYIGGWNERGYDKTWYENLRSTLNTKGYTSTKVVADDGFGWGVADDMAKDPAFKAAVDVVGSHYVCGYLSSGATCNSTATAQALGKPLWASENGSQDTDTGAAAVARAINRGYIDGRMTSFMNWPVIAALYPNETFSTDGMSVAAQPWSGNYRIGRTTWATAHTTQFTKPGWHYIDSAGGYLGGAKANGSYVTLKSTNNTDYSTVIETMDATALQSATFTVSGGLSTGKVHVWATNLKSSNSADHFVQAPDVTPVNGTYTLTLQPGYVYTVTTTTGQGKGTATPPAATPLALPYSDNFETAAASTSPKYFADMNGAFATHTCGASRAGTCLRQMAPTQPINWTHESYHAPYTFMGDGSWSNYTVGTDALFEQAGTVEVLGRIGTQGKNNQGLNAYHLQLSDTGAWTIKRSDTVPDPNNAGSTTWAWTQLASGTVAALGTNTWHTIALKMEGSTLTVVIDGTTVGTATDATYTSGPAGLGVTGYQTEQFDNFALTAGTVSSHTGPITSGVPGKCVDDNANSNVNGTHVQIWDCNGTNAQKWTFTNGTLQVNGKCLDVTGRGTANGTLVDLWDCNGGANQQWTPQPDGTLKGTQSGRCLDDPRGTATNGTQLDIWDCNGGFNQKWTLP